MKHQSRLKVLQKLYIINNVIFRPHWFEAVFKMMKVQRETVT